MRGSGSLQDKFRSVLNSMGIELEYIDDTTDTGSLGLASPNYRILGANGDLANSARRTPQRRRSSHGDAANLDAEDTPDAPANTGHRRVRSLSNGPSKHVAQKLRFADEENGHDATQETQPKTEVEHHPAFRNLAHRPHLLPAPVFKSGANTKTYQNYARGSPRQPLRGLGLGKRGMPDRTQDSVVDESPLRNGHLDDVSSGQRSPERDITHPLSDPGKEYGVHFEGSHQFHQEAADDEPVDGEIPEDGSYEGGRSDDEQNATFDQVAFLEATEQNFLRSAFDCWRRVAQVKQLNSQQRMALAARWDREEAIAEALAIWNENAGVRVEDIQGRTATATLQDRQEEAMELTRHEADALEPGTVDFYEAFADAKNSGDQGYRDRLRNQPEDYDDSLDIEDHPKYAQAAAAWDYFLLSKAFTHWAGRAEEEVQRTAVARRHIMRKKCFGAWVEQKAEDDSRVSSFPKIFILRQWYDAHSDQEHSARIIDQAYERGLIERVFWAWHGEYNVRHNLGKAAQRAKKDKFQAWRSATSAATQASEFARLDDRQHLLKTATSALISRFDALKTANLKAEQIVDTKSLLLKSDTFKQWRQQSKDLDSTAEQIDKEQLQQAAKHWLCEKRLREYQRMQRLRELEEYVHQWHCETRLEVVKRWLREKSLRSIANKWSAAALKAETNGQNLYETAAAMDRTHLVATFFESARPAVKEIETQADTADSMFRQETIPTALAHWKEELSVKQRLGRWSDLGAFYSGVKDRFDHWRVNAKRARKQRFVDIYRAFRFQYKLDMVQNCLDVWRAATADAITSTWDADDIRASHDRSVVEESVQVWRNELSFVEFSNQVAVEADQEAYLIAWQAEVAAMKEAEMDAQEYDAGQTLNEHWEDWVLATLQQRSRHPTIVEMQNHNAKRLRRHALTLWFEQTFPNREPETDFRTSRRSARFITPARNRQFVDYSNYSFRPPSELTFDEHDEGPSFEDSRL